jgi:hypothetical protein
MLSQMAEQDFGAVFGRLREIMAEQARAMDVVADGPAGYRLNTRHVRRDGYVLMFGAVEIKKRYVSYHLMPVYMAAPGVLPISEQLRRRMQGKACFNFTRIDEDLFAELSDLTRRSVEHDSVPWEALPGTMERVDLDEWRLADRP